MSESNGIQRQPSAPAPASIPPSPSDPVAASLARRECPHCHHALTAKDVEDNLCWYCDDSLTGPRKPRPPEAPLAGCLFGLIGAMVGTAVGLLITGPGGRGSWTVSICGGIGYGCGSALARAIFCRPPPKS
jgi:hypothetical protein